MRYPFFREKQYCIEKAHLKKVGQACVTCIFKTKWQACVTCLFKTICFKKINIEHGTCLYIYIVSSLNHSNADNDTMIHESL